MSPTSTKMCQTKILVGFKPTEFLYRRIDINNKHRITKRRRDRREISFIKRLLHHMDSGILDLGDYDPDVDDCLEQDLGLDDLELEKLLEDAANAPYESVVSSIQRLGLTSDADLPTHWKLLVPKGFVWSDNRLDRLKKFALDKLGYVPYEWQLMAACALFDGDDIVIQVRTGGGKSTVFQLLLADLRQIKPKMGPPRSTVLIISPLIGLAKEQEALLNKCGIPVCALTAEALELNFKAGRDLWKEIDKGTYRVVIASPEILLGKGSYFWTRMAPLRSKHRFLRHLVAIVIDEAHCAYKYGESGFRPEYSKLGSFRAFFHDVPFCCLSATIPPNVREYLYTSLKLHNQTYFLQQSIHRSNIDLNFIPMKSTTGFEILSFLVNTVRDPELIPKTLVYIDSKAKAQGIAIYIRKALKSQLRAIEGAQYRFQHDDVSATVAVYSAIISPARRDKIMQDFKLGKIRILICTDAAGMGMDIRTVQRVVQFGVPKHLTISDLVQRIGRCARQDDIRGAAFVLVEDNYIYGNRDTATPELRSLLGDLPDFSIPVTTTNKFAIDQFLKSIYVHDIDSDRRRIFPLDPGILFLVNTHGCTSRALLALFADPLTHVEFEKPCGCNNCVLKDNEGPLARNPKYRAVPPPNLRLTAVKTVRLREEMKGTQEYLERKEAARNFNLQAAARDMIYMREGFGFKMENTIRYRDTCAWTEKAQMDAHALEVTKYSLEKKQTANAVAIEQVATILTDLREFLYERAGGENLHVRLASFFPDILILRLSRAAGVGKINSVEDLQLQILDKDNFNFSTSLLNPYQKTIFNAISDVMEPYTRAAEEARRTQAMRRVGTGRGTRLYEHSNTQVDISRLDPNNPGDATFIQRQRELKEYEAQVETNMNQRQKKAMENRATLDGEKAVIAYNMARLKAETHLLSKITNRKNTGARNASKGLPTEPEEIEKDGVGNDVDMPDVDEGSNLGSVRGGGRGRGGRGRARGAKRGGGGKRGAGRASKVVKA